MHLDTDALVVPGEHMLHVLNRRGLFHVKGHDVHRLYERLTPFFEASPRLDDLLLRIPQAQRPAVRECLEKLRDLGALCDDATVPAVRATDEVLFMSPLEAGRKLLQVRAGQWSGRLTCVTVDGDIPADADAYGRWLRRHGGDVLTESEWIRVYALSRTGELRRLAVVSPSGEPGLQALPGQLGIVRCADVDQVPLVVLTAAHPLFTPAITRAGLRHITVRDELLREFIARLHLAEDAGLRARFYCGPIASPLARYAPVSVSAAAIASMCVAPTLTTLQLEVLDRCAVSRARAASEYDLLQSRDTHRPFVAHLQQIVRVRRRQLLAQASESADGLHTFRIGSRSAASFVRAKALADLLLAHIWDEFYRDARLDSGLDAGEPVLRCAYADVATDDEQRAALQRAQAGACRAPQRPLFRFRTVRRWGIAAWVGDLLLP